MLALQAVTPEALSLELGVKLAEARKLVAAVHRGEWSEALRLDGVSRRAHEAARARGHVPSLEVRARQASALDPFVKLVLSAPDGQVMEAVRIPLERPGRFSACVSSQAGCALACAFCATGRLGLARNLEAWEIVEQVRELRSTLPPGGRIHGVVFQGMGEPLANADRVIEAIRVVTNPCTLAIDTRAITVCTSGLPTGILRLAREVPKVRLAVSIASARREVRRALMPIDDTFPLDEVVDAVEQHARTTGLAPMWALTPLSGVNDTDADARALSELVRKFEARSGVRPRVSVVPYNSIDEASKDPFSRGDVGRFVDRLIGHGLRPHVRYSGGSDIAAACGQLASRRLTAPDPKGLRSPGL